MAHFTEVLNKVRMVLTWAFPGEVQALLQGLVEEGIISEAYRKSLTLHWPNDAMVPTCTRKSEFGEWRKDLNSQGSMENWDISQELMDQVRTTGSKSLASDHKAEQRDSASSIEGPNNTRFNLHRNLPRKHEMFQRNQEEMQELLEEVSMDVSCSNQECFSSDSVSDWALRSSAEKAEPLRCASSEPDTDNESVNRNLENEEWLEQVEESARRIAIPLWQNWDRGGGMLRTLLSCLPKNFSVSDGMLPEGEAQRAILNMEDEMGLATVLGSFGTCVADFDTAEPGVGCNMEVGRSERVGLHFSTPSGVAVLSTEDFRIHRATKNASPVEASEATGAGYITEKLETLDVWWQADKTADAVDDLFGFTADALCHQCETNSGHSKSTFRHHPCSGASEDNRTVQQDDFHYSLTEGSTDYLKDVSRDAAGYGLDQFREIQEKMDLHCDAKMQEFDQDSMGLLDFGYISDLLDNEDYLVSQLDPAMLLNNDLGPDCIDENIINSDVAVVLAASDLANHNDQREESKPKDKIKPKRKRQRDAQFKMGTNGNSRAKRQKVIDSQKNHKAMAEPTVDNGFFLHSVDAETVVAEPMRGLPTTPPGNLLVFPPHSANSIPIQLITFPESSAYEVVQLSSSSPPLIRLPLHNTAAMPTYFFVPTPSPACKRQVPPLSPADGAVAPFLMSSIQPGSMSDAASKTMSPSAAPPSPISEISPCREAPKSPTVVEIPLAVKDYIHQSKTLMSQGCQHMEANLRLDTHYVDVNVSQREILRSVKNANKCLDKELIITGDIDRQKSSLGQSQIFDSLNGKRYNLLLGNAGMGKTTLIKKLCLDWSRDAIPQFDFVFLLDGKQLILTEPVHSLQTLLLSRSSFAPPCTDPEGVYAQILAARKRVLIVFDGFDELRDYEMLLQTQEKDLVASLQKDGKAQAYTVKQLFSGILQRVLLPGCTLLLATRPRGTASQLLRRADSFLEVCGFTPANVEAYMSQYFSDSELVASALDFLKSNSYLQLLCWNPGLCHLVCTVLEQCKSLGALPRSLTALCHKVLCLKIEKDRASTESPVKPQEKSTVEPADKTEITNISQGRRRQRNNRTRPRAVARTSSRNQKAMRTKRQEKLDEEDVGEETYKTEDRELLSQLSSLAWEGVKSNVSVIPRGRTVSTKLREFGLRTGLLVSQSFIKRTPAKIEQMNEEAGEVHNGMGAVKKETGRESGGNTEKSDECEDHLLSWANPFLQSYMAAIHLSLSRTVTDRSFLQTLPLQTGSKGRRKPQREELELTQRLAVGLLFHNRTELRRLHSYTETVFRDLIASKQAVVIKHLEGLSFGDLSSAQILEACNYVHEASFTCQESGPDTNSNIQALLVANLPESLTFRGVPLSPPDVFTVQNALKRAGAEGRSFCLDLEDSGIRIHGLRTLVGLSNINTYRACIADVVTLWEELERLDGDGHLQGAVSKFKIHPLKATQVCHIEHLEKLVAIHTNKRLSDDDSSSSQSGSILAEGVPAVKELYKLEFEVGPENSPLVLPKLWNLLPGLHNLQHLDVENSKIGDKGAEKLADALVSLRSLEILNLSENCIGDQGVRKLAFALKDLPKLHCLSLYSNLISDEGAESLAAVLPHMASLTDLDVKYNKMTDVGALSLGASLRNCKKVKTLRMWNQCIPYRVFERLQQQDSRILWH